MVCDSPCCPVGNPSATRSVGIPRSQRGVLHNCHTIILFLVPVMAMAAKRTVASVHEVVPLGTLDPETIVTPSIFVHSIVQIPRTATVGGGFKKQA